MASIRRRGKGWQARVQRRGHREVLKTFSTRVDAEKWARAVERDLDMGVYRTHARPTSPTLKVLLLRYCAEVSPTKRGGVMEAIRLKAMAARPIGQVEVAALSPSVIAQYRDERLQSVSGSTVNRDLDDLSAVLGHAHREWGMPGTNEARKVRRPPKGAPRRRVLLEGEEERLMEALVAQGRSPHGRLQAECRNPWVKPAVQLAILTAMRRGELLSLRWDNIDPGNRTATLPITKNGDTRLVPLSRAAVAVLEGLPRCGNGRVFQLTSNALQKAFVRAVDRAGLSDLRFHDLRHTAATRMSRALPNVIELAAVTGHRDLRMLARYYHPSATDLARKLDAMLEGP